MFFEDFNEPRLNKKDLNTLELFITGISELHKLVNDNAIDRDDKQYTKSSTVDF